MVHCEKTMWVLWASIIAIIGSGILYFTVGLQLNDYLVYLIGIAFVGGALGSVYYRISNGKDPWWHILGGD